MKISKVLTWDGLANEYKKATGRTARTQPMDKIFDWAEKQNDKFFVDYDKKTIHKIKKEVNLMKTKIFRSGEKGFEEEKAKMFTGALTKEEQLEKVFPTILNAMLAEYAMIQYGGMSVGGLKEKYAKILLREVKIRVNLK